MAEKKMTLKEAKQILTRAKIEPIDMPPTVIKALAAKIATELPKIAADLYRNK